MGWHKNLPENMSMNIPSFVSEILKLELHSSQISLGSLDKPFAFSRLMIPLPEMLSPSSSIC